MNRNLFDEAMRRRADAEEMALSARAEEHFSEAIEQARRRPAESRPKRGWKISALIAAECALALAVALFFWPRQDATYQGTLPQPTQAEISAAMAPVVQQLYAKAPEVDFTVEAEKSITLTTHARNDTEDIWLVAWQADMKNGDMPAEQLLWMEPGTQCSARAWWPWEEKVELNMTYSGYRVTARLLHWLDGEWLEADQAGYEEQQSIIESAFEAGALILAPGIWINGEAGPMRLVLPAAYQAEHPDQTALAYYVEKGMLQDAYLLCSGGEAFVSEARTWASED